VRGEKLLTQGHIRMLKELLRGPQKDAGGEGEKGPFAIRTGKGRGGHQMDKRIKLKKANCRKGWGGKRKRGGGLQSLTWDTSMQKRATRGGQLRSFLRDN